MPTALHTFARANADDADEARPTSDFIAGINLFLEPGYVAPATGNVAVPGYVPLPAPTTYTTASATTYRVDRVNVYTAPGDAYNLPKTFYYAVASGTYPNADSTYYVLVLDGYTAGVLSKTPPFQVVSYAQAFQTKYFTPDDPSVIPPGLTYNEGASTIVLNGTETRPVDTGDIGRQVCIGGFADPTTETAIELHWDSVGRHRLVRYDPGGNSGAGSRTTLLEWSGLALSESLIPQGGILDNILYYLDANGEVRAVNLKRAADGEYTVPLLAADAYSLHAVKRPPVGRPRGTRMRNVDPNDPRRFQTITHDSAWQIAVRYRYRDGEVTPLGNYSDILPRVPSVYAPVKAHPSRGTITEIRPTPIRTNFVRIESICPDVPPLVESVELCVRRDNETVFIVAEAFTRDYTTYPGTGFPSTFDFYGQTTGAAVTAAEQSKQAEALSIRVEALGIARSRLFVGDCTEGYPDPPIQLTAQAESRKYVDENSPRWPYPYYFDRILQQGPVWEVLNNPTAGGSYTTYYTLYQGIFGEADSTYLRVKKQSVGPGSESPIDQGTSDTTPIESRWVVMSDGAAGDYGTARALEPMTYADAMGTNGTVTRTPTLLGSMLDVYGLSFNYGGVGEDARMFRSLSHYQVGIRGYDALGRTSAVVPAKTPPLYIANVDEPVVFDEYTSSVGYFSDSQVGQSLSRLKWDIDTSVVPIAQQLPDWMETFSVCVTENDRFATFVETSAADILVDRGLKSDGTTRILDPIKIDADDPDGEKVSGVLWVDIGHLATNSMYAYQLYGTDPDNYKYVGLPLSNGTQYPLADFTGSRSTSGLHTGYVFDSQSGDRILFKDTGVDAQIIEQRGDHLLINYAGQMPISKTARIIIYTPRSIAQGESAPYYEASVRFRVLRDNTGVATGYEPVDAYGYIPDGIGSQIIDKYIYGDTYRVIRRRLTAEMRASNDQEATSGTLEDVAYTPPNYKTYPSTVVLSEYEDPNANSGPSHGWLGTTFHYVEAMNSDDRVYADWLAARRGRVGLSIQGGGKQVRRKTLLRFSGTKVAGTLLNGTASWEVFSQYEKLPQEQGAVTALLVGDQNASDGNVLVALQEFGAASLYLEQKPIQVSPDSQLLTVVDQVVGGENSLRGGFGCQDVGTVIPYGGKIFYFSREKQEIMRYNNGLTPLGLAFKFRERIKSVARLYEGATVRACFDPRRQEYLLTFQPIGSLPGVTLVWSERREGFADAYSFVPYAGLALHQELLTWQGIDLHRHTVEAPVGTFFGEYTAPSVTFGPSGLLSKTWQAIGIRSEARWVPTLITTPSGQRSRMLPGWLSFIEGIWRGAFRRDETTPGTGSEAQKLNGGRTLQSSTAYITLSCPEENPAPLQSAQVQFIENAGQRANQ